jgi:hypothetical protein
MTIRHIAGLCPEEAIWKMMADVSDTLLTEDNSLLLTEDSIVVDGEMFTVNSSPTDTHAAEQVWAIGAMAYYMATGHTVFGGHGKNYQQAHPHVTLPAMPKGMQGLTPIMQQCLHPAPKERIGLEQLREKARQGLAVCKARTRQPLPHDTDRPAEKKYNNQGQRWPEEMTKI